MTESISLLDALNSLPAKGERSKDGVCFYCRRYASRLEWDHFPIPYVFGGDTLVPACLTCHDLKDRRSILDWPGEVIHEAFEGLTPMAALLVAKALRIGMDGQVPTEERRAPRDGPRS